MTLSNENKIENHLTALEPLATINPKFPQKKFTNELLASSGLITSVEVDAISVQSEPRDAMVQNGAHGEETRAASPAAAIQDIQSAALPAHPLNAIILWLLTTIAEFDPMETRGLKDGGNGAAGFRQDNHSFMLVFPNTFSRVKQPLYPKRWADTK